MYCVLGDKSTIDYITICNTNKNIPYRMAQEIFNCFVRLQQCTEVRFASLLSSGFTTMAVINPPEKNLANRTSVQWIKKMKKKYLQFPIRHFQEFHKT